MANIPAFSALTEWRAERAAVGLSGYLPAPTAQHSPWHWRSVGKPGTAILQEVADKHGLMLETARTKCHKQVFVTVRQEAAYRLRVELRWSWSRISACVGLTNGTTAWHGARRHARRHGLKMPPEGRL